MATVRELNNYPQGNFEGGGAERKCGAKSAYEFRDLGTFSAKFAPAGALIP